MQRFSTRLPYLALAVLGLGVFMWVQAGDLEPPPGPPVPTMKTLAEIEGGTPIRSADLPLEITSPGLYYLVEDISTTGDGIRISTSNVTLDLRGFTLSGGTGHGVSETSEFVGNNKVRNGRVQLWDQNGVYLGDGGEVERIYALVNGGVGIVVNGWPTTGSVSNSVAIGNQTGGISGNTIENCRAEGNQGFGIATDGPRVADCTVVDNPIGIVLNDNIGSVAERNVCVQNLKGIVAYGSGHIIRANNIVDNDLGMEVVGDNNVIVQNVARAVTGYSIASGNDVGTIGSAASSTGFWTNIEF